MFMRHATEEATQIFVFNATVSHDICLTSIMASLSNQRSNIYHIYSCTIICNLLHLHIMKKAAIQIVFGLERKECVFISYNLVIFFLYYSNNIRIHQHIITFEAREYRQSIIFYCVNNTECYNKISSKSI